jgi:hypothetical protein
MDVVGYAIIREGADAISPIPLEKFYKNRVRVMEFATDGGVLVIDNYASGLAMFDKKDVISSFRCEPFMGVICPPNLTMGEKFEYYARCMNRQGGYNSIVREMVIAVSLHRGEFSDSLLWQAQDEPAKYNID